MEIKRNTYLQQLIEQKDSGMIKVITGIRRCDKTLLSGTWCKWQQSFTICAENTM